MALLKVIKQEDKLKYLKELAEVVANEAKFCVISSSKIRFCHEIELHCPLPSGVDYHPF